MEYISSIAQLQNAFAKLPGVGRKTAQRYAYAVVTMPQEQAEAFAQALLDVKKQVKFCTVCGNITDKDVCELCQKRKHNIICVVKEPKDVTAIEKTQCYNGVYHVLHGTINPMQGVGPNDIRIKELLARVAEGGVDEVIMATNPDVEGDATAMYIAKLLKPLGIKVTRIAQGVSMGSELEYADEVTLHRALEDRKQL